MDGALLRVQAGVLPDPGRRAPGAVRDGRVGALAPVRAPGPGRPGGRLHSQNVRAAGRGGRPAPGGRGGRVVGRGRGGGERVVAAGPRGPDGRQPCAAVRSGTPGAGRQASSRFGQTARASGQGDAPSPDGNQVRAVCRQ